MNDLKGIIEDCNKNDLVSNKVIKKVIEIIGQEEWQDLHDENSDVCTTMGELIITLKGIAYLEKENAELKEKYLYVVNRSPCLAELEENITKAKEIIRKLYSHVFQGMGFMELNDFNVQKAEVEQFLNSEVEK